jgi:quercetin dioxygenase-like cupin family protein
MTFMRRLSIALTASVVAGAVAATTIAFANPALNAVTTVLGHRATLADSVQVNEDRVKFQTKDPTDMVVQKVTFQAQGNSGWHYHPGVVLVVVESGHVTTHDANCQTKTYGPAEAFVESGNTPFMVSNESTTEVAVDFATVVSPAGGPFRVETDPPACAHP